jgi:hypothetical protein
VAANDHKISEGKDQERVVRCFVAKMSSKNKNRRLYLVIFGYIYRNLAQLRLKLAPVFGLGAACAFLVFFCGEVSDKGKAVPPPSRWLAAYLTEQGLSHALNVPFLDGVVNGFFAFLTGKDDKFLSLCRLRSFAA